MLNTNPNAVGPLEKSAKRIIKNWGLDYLSLPTKFFLLSCGFDIVDNPDEVKPVEAVEEKVEVKEEKKEAQPSLITGCGQEPTAQRCQVCSAVCKYKYGTQEYKDRFWQFCWRMGRPLEYFLRFHSAR